MYDRGDKNRVLHLPLCLSKSSSFVLVATKLIDITQGVRDNSSQ